MVRRAKSEGLPVTAEAAPHHFTLTDGCAAGYDPVFKVNPPLRPPADRAAVRRGLADGTIDAIATDHAPHAPEAKDVPFAEAPPGMLGLETALAVTLSAMTAPGDGAEPDGPTLTVEAVFSLLSWRPAVIAGLTAADPRPAGHSPQGQPVAPGTVANLCVVDPTALVEVDPDRLASRSRNTPYAGRTLRGRVRHTVLRGEPVVRDGQAQR